MLGAARDPHHRRHREGPRRPSGGRGLRPGEQLTPEAPSLAQHFGGKEGVVLAWFFVLSFGTTASFKTEPKSIISINDLYLRWVQGPGAKKKVGFLDSKFRKLLLNFWWCFFFLSVQLHKSRG